MALKKTYHSGKKIRNGDLPDNKLIEAYRSRGDRNAIDILIHRYLHLVYGVCLKYLKQPEKAEDAAMEILEKLLDDLKHHDVSHFPGWLYRVCKNHCLMRLRKKEPLMFASQVDDPRLKSELIMEFDHEVHLNQKERDIFKILDHALNQLNKEQQKCIRLFYLEKRSYNEIANITGMDLKKVKSHIQNGKRNLKKEIIKNGKFKK